MASEKTVDPDLQELHAIRLFVAGFKFRGKPVKVSDAHCLIAKETQIKNYLKSKWNLSRLDGFFLKYPHYFSFSANREVYLRDPSLEVLEIDCALWFLRFMKARNNLPIHVTLAFSCVPTSIVRDYLKSKFDTCNLTLFFERHSDLFDVKFSYVYLRSHRASASPQTKVQTKVESNSQTPLSKRAQKRLNEKERKAVDFFVNLLKTRLLISSHHAHSFIGEDQELHSYLRETYTISNLTPFFMKYPKIFAVHGSMVALVPNQENPVSSSSSVSTSSVSTVSSENTKETQPAECLKSVSIEKTKQPEACVLPVEKRAVVFYKNLIAKKGPFTTRQAHSFLGDKVEIREWLKENYTLNDLTSFFQNHPQTFIVKDDLVDLAGLKSNNTAQAQTGIAKSSAPVKQDGSELKTEEKEKRAVDFYVKLLKTQVLISMLHAVSFIHEEPELQKYLRDTYSTSDLTTFFEKYPKIFTKYGSLVGLVSHENSVSNVPSEHTKKPQQTESLKTVSVEKIKQPQPEKCVLQGPSANSIPSNSPASAPVLKSYKIFGDEVKASSAEKIAPCLLSKIMLCTSSQQAATNGSSHKVLPLSRPETFQDAACQTLSSGPILSLSVFDEHEKSS